MTQISAAQKIELLDVVDRFYPRDRLTAVFDPSDRLSGHEVLATEGDQPTVVIAAYTDRSNGAVRAMRRSAAGAWELAFDSPDTWAIPGRGCEIRLREVDFDDRPEAFVSFFGARASVFWAFKWDGSALVNLTPTTDGARQSSLLLSASVYDLDLKDGLRVIAERAVERPGPGQRPRNPAYVYRLGPNGFEVEKTILAVMGFRGDVAPTGNVRSFKLIQDSQAPYTLRVINGDRSGGKRVTGATIFINNEWVLDRQQVNDQTAITTVTIPRLFTENRLTATLTGPPDGQIIVLAEDSTPR